MFSRSTFLSVAAFGYRPPRQFAILQPTLPFFALLSVLWTVWDPTYSSFRSAKIQGRDVRVRGKKQYIVGIFTCNPLQFDNTIFFQALQMMAWASRVATSVLLALFWFRSHLDHLNLTHDPPSSRSRLYFCTSLALELFVRPARYVDVPSHDLYKNLDLHRILRRSPTATTPSDPPP
jgi:hypothetical protein